MNPFHTRELIIEIFENLNKKSIEYCVLDPHFKLPDWVDCEIDILIAEDNRHRFVTVVDYAISNLNWKRFSIRDNYGEAAIWLYRVVVGEVYLLKLTLIFSILWTNKSWLDIDYVIGTRRENNMFYIPRDGVYAAYMAVNEILTGKGNPAILEKCVQLSLRDREGFYESLIPVFREFTDELYNKVSTGDWDSLDRFELEKMILAKPFHVMDYVHLLKHNIMDLTRAVILPAGGLIAFMGTDGAGKTTMINFVTDKLQPLFQSIHYFHRRFESFPSMKPRVFHKNVNKKPFTSANSIEQGFSNTDGSLLKAILLWLNLIYRTLEFFVSRLKIRKIASQSGLIIFDRYYYGYFALIPYRRMIWPYRRILMAIVPKPRVVFYLSIDPEIAFRRKREWPIEEIETQDSNFRRIMLHIDTGYIIDTNRDVNVVGAEICEIILDSFSVQ